MTDVVHHEPHRTGEIRLLDTATLGAGVVPKRTSESARVAFIRDCCLDLLFDRVDVHVFPPTGRSATGRVAFAACLVFLVLRAVG
jgi:hypothetical protein